MQKGRSLKSQVFINKNMEDKKWYSSSANSNNISLTIKGIGIAIIPALIFLGGFFGISLVETDLVELVNSIAVLVSAVTVVIGVGRKIYIKLFK